AGIALDAATRGLRVALVEARDLASGTSSRSSKMFHGGLRYLEQLEFGLVREALAERELSMSTLAPHLVKPLRCLYPLTHRVWELFDVASERPLFESWAGDEAVPAQFHPSRHEEQRLAAVLPRDEMMGAVSYPANVVDYAR